MTSGLNIKRKNIDLPLDRNPSPSGDSWFNYFKNNLTS